MTTPGGTSEGEHPATGGAEDPLAPPRLLARPAAPAPLPPSLGQSEAIAQLHRRWAQLHGAPVVAPAAPAAPSPPPDAERAAPAAPRIPGVRAKVRARVATAAAGVQQADRAMTGDLVRAVDALAQRIDEIAGRVGELEALVQEVVDTVSEDLVRLRVALGTAPGGPGGPKAPG